MQKIFMLVCVISLSACATVETSVLPNNTTHGYTVYDPCVRCGESWIFLNLDETKELEK